MTRSLRAARVLLLLAGLILALSAPKAVAQKRAQKRAQTPRDDSEFRALHNPVISADGAWVAAEERPDRGDGNVRVWSTEGDVTFTLERGQNPRISRDSRWVSALQKPSTKRAGQSLVLLDTQSGSSRIFEHVQSYEMTSSSTWLVYLQSQEVKADEEESSKKERKVRTLHLVHLESDAIVSVANVIEHAVHETNDHVAYAFYDEEAGHDRLHIAALHPRGNSAFLTWHVTGPSVAGKLTRVDTPQ